MEASLFGPAVALVCEGCGTQPPRLVTAPYPFRCENAGKDAIDHVVAPHLDPSRGVWPAEAEDRPFVKYRHLLHAHAAALSLGLGDEGYLRIVDRLDSSLIRVDGRSFRTTPLARVAPLEAAIGLGGEIWVKNDTINVSGSHKGRHLFGVLLHLEIVRAAGLEPIPVPPLAIASCGNAALAAAVCARAADRTLAVMVPPDAHPHVLSRLRELGADIHIHSRAPGELGDPTVTAFRRAVAGGALPFACQGTECGLTLDGGKTLGFELAASGVSFERLFVQIGGGALASSVARGFEAARSLGAMPRLPRLMAVQTSAVAPLSRVYFRIVERVRGLTPGETLPIEVGDALADALRGPALLPVVTGILAEVARDRAAWLPPWDDPKPSLAHGILDDETYDALAILRAMFATGGSPVIVDEATVAEAETLGASTTGIDADATGTSGLAGLLTWSRSPGSPRGERIAVLFTGARR